VRSTSDRLDTSNLFLALCLVVFVVFLVDSYDMEEASSYLLPRLVCVFGLVVGSIKLLVGYAKPRRVNDEASQNESGTKGLHIAYSIAFVAAYFFSTLLLGFILSTAIAMLAFSYLTKFPRKKLAVALSVAIPLILHLAFVTLLQASLPAGVVEKLLF
jgi:Tripartite tricarboxylate transporter TctB family